MTGTPIFTADARPLDREEWLKLRRSSIGASDCPAIMGQSPYRTALQVYADKLGLVPDEEATIPQRVGNHLEPLILDLYEEATSFPLERRQVFLRHPQLPWMTCTLDALRSDGRPVEAKSVGQFAGRDWGEPGTDEVPAHVLLQVHHQLIVSDRCEGDVAVLRGGSFNVHTVEADAEIGGLILAAEEEFVERLRREIPPAPTGEDCQILRLLYPEPMGLQRWDEEWASAVEMYEAMGRQIASVEDQRKVLKAQLLSRLGESEAAELPDGRMLKRTMVDRKQYTVEATTYQTLLVKKAKVAR